ncbi:hypothetical protein [Paenarthrobacter nitroguajacolicus]|uniref:hypothetical protein n=1 Tax=Paenarthrobacter nitroguajacolicus TaxID=211146 RepID=UPI00286D014A|nr:hypothetical protein [Paenarthrobacter nitroguajacolicus]
MSRRFRRPFPAAIMAGIFLFLTACSVPVPSPPPSSAPSPSSPRQSIPHDADTGQTLAEAREAIEAVPGISVTGFVGGGAPNVKGNTGYSVAFDIDPGYTVSYGDLLVDYIIRTVWSVGEGYMPTTDIRISARTADGDPLFDLTAAAVGSAWLSPRTSTPSQYSTVVIPLSADDPEGARNLMNFQRDGSWPGVIPKPLLDTVSVKHD